MPKSRGGQHLLGSALHTLTTRVSILVILVHRAAAVAAAKHTALLRVVEVLEVGGLGHRIGRQRLLSRWWEKLAKTLVSGRIIGPVSLGELDVEANVHVTKIVVSVRRHTLAANHLDRP